MILFHGSYMSITAPNASAGLAGKDFGNGFYLSDNQPQAEEFADWKCDKYSLSSTPFVNAYICDDHILEQGKRKHLRIKKFKGYSIEWVDFVYQHRQCKKIVPSDYDIVYGPVADGDMEGLFPKFEAHEITKEQLLEGLKNTKGITFQYYFGTEKAMQQLCFYCSYQLLSPYAIGNFIPQDTTLLTNINWNLSATKRILVDCNIHPVITSTELTNEADTYTATSSTGMSKTSDRGKALIKAREISKKLQKR